MNIVFSVLIGVLIFIFLGYLYIKHIECYLYFLYKDLMRERKDLLKINSLYKAMKTIYTAELEYLTNELEKKQAGVV